MPDKFPAAVSAESFTNTALLGFSVWFAAPVIAVSFKCWNFSLAELANAKVLLKVPIVVLPDFAENVASACASV